MEQWFEELKRRGIVDGEADGSPDPDALAARLASLPASAANAELLQIVAKAAPKRLAKEARRLLHLWRSRGLLASAPLQKGQIWRLESQPKPLRALLSHLDGRGDRFAVYSFSRPGSPYVVMVTVGNDSTGLVHAEVHEPANKRDFQTLMDGLRRLEDVTWVDTDPAYCRALLKHFYRLNRERHAAVPREFELYRPALGPDEPLPPPPIYDRLTAAEVGQDRSSLLAGSGELLAEKEMATWYLEGTPVDEAVEKLEARQHSPLIISNSAEEEMAEKVKQQLLGALFTPEFRRTFARRLEEMAYIFWETGRPLRARQAVALAQALQEDMSLNFIPFFQNLVDKTIALAVSQREEEKDEVGRPGRGLYVPDLRRLALP